MITTGIEKRGQKKMIGKKMLSLVMVLAVMVSFTFAGSTTAYAATGSRTAIYNSTHSVGADVGKTGTSTEISFRVSAPSNAVVTKVVVTTGVLSAKGTFSNMQMNLSNSNGAFTKSWNGAGNTDVTFATEFNGDLANDTYTLTLTGKCVTGYYANGLMLNYGLYSYNRPSITVYYTY